MTLIQTTAFFLVRRGLLLLFGVALIFAFSSCTESLEPSSATPPTDGVKEPGEWPAPVIPINSTAPAVTIVSPDNGTKFSAETVLIRGGAMDDGGLATVFVQVGYNAPILAESGDGFRTWQLEALAPYGSFEVRAWAYDRDGQKSSEDASITLERLYAPSDVLPPTVEITAPEDGSNPLHSVVVLSGISADDRGVTRMELMLNGVPQNERGFETSDQFASWSRVVPLLPGVENELTVRAYDASGNMGSAQLSLHARPQDDRVAPTLTLLSPSEDERVNIGTLLVRGNASDNLAVREVKVRVAKQQNDSCDDVSWSPYVFSTTTDGFANFEAPLVLDRGPLCVEARAIDISGISTSVVHKITNDFVAVWSPETSYALRLHPLASKPQVRLELTRQGIGEIMSEDIQRALTIAELDLEPVLLDALLSIKSACGTCWTGSGSGCSSTSHYDCTRTDLGCSFGEGPNCTGWQDSPEYALIRLLTMTPHNGDITGSSLGQMASVVNAINSISFGLVDSFAEVIAASLKIGQNDEYVPTHAVVQAMKEGVIATHPAFVQRGDDYLLPVTLYDALRDLEPLRDVLGPADNGHPGVADPSFPIHGVVFPEESFRMILVAESNLRWHDGLQFGSGKNYLSSIVDEVGPTFDDVVEFDFHDPDRFQIVGLPSTPTVDLRFSLYESPRNIPVCSGNSCKTHLPDAPRPDYAWALEPWILEHILARAAYHAYSQPPLHAYKEYRAIFRLAEIFVGHAGGRKSNPWAWLEMSISNLGQVFTGNPPPPQYMWEAIMDVAEVVGHRNIKPQRPSPRCPNLGNNEDAYTICEGDLNPKFTLYNVDTGVTASALEEASRTQLEAQREVLTQRLLGGFEENNGCVDFYYIERDGKRMLWETIAGDPVPSSCGVRSQGGFYADEGLTQRVSSPSIDGVAPSAHQKWEVHPGEHVLYKLGNDRRVWRLTVNVPSEVIGNHEIHVRTTHQL